MNSLHLDPKKTALILIDLQNGIVAMPTAPHTAAEVIQKSHTLAKSFRAVGASVIYVRVDLTDFLTLAVDAPHAEPGAPPPPAFASKLAPEAGFEDGDLLITKRHWGPSQERNWSSICASAALKLSSWAVLRPTTASNRRPAKAPGWDSPLSSWKTPRPVSTPMRIASPLNRSSPVSAA
jgi:hypothetical protein